MAIRIFGLLLASGIMVATAKVDGIKVAAPMEILAEAGTVLYDAYEAAYAAGEGFVIKNGLHTKVKSTIGDDPIEAVCKKVGCKKKDITDKLSQAQEIVAHAKAQAYEHAAKINDKADKMTADVVGMIEKKFPSYTGVLPHDWEDFVFVVAIYALVLYVALRIALFCFKVSMAIMCCVLCCRCRSRAAKSDKPAAKAKAAAGKAGAKAKAGGKK